LSLKNSTSGHIEVNLLGIDIHAIPLAAGANNRYPKNKRPRNGRFAHLAGEIPCYRLKIPCFSKYFPC
jgi:hypothetical protein